MKIQSSLPQVRVIEKHYPEYFGNPAQEGINAVRTESFHREELKKTVTRLKRQKKSKKAILKYCQSKFKNLLAKYEIALCVK